MVRDPEKSTPMRQWYLQWCHPSMCKVREREEKNKDIIDHLFVTSEQVRVRECICRVTGIPSPMTRRTDTLVVLTRTAVECLDRADDIGRFEQMPAGIRLLRTGSHRHRVHMVLRQVKLLKSTEHICQPFVSKSAHINQDGPTNLRR